MACSGYTIQSVAKRCGMTTHTLRYYERVGLIRPIARGSNGHRCYSAADEQWLKVIHFMRITQMPIRDLQHYVSLRLGNGTGAPELHRILEDHRSALRKQIADLERACELLTHHLGKLEMVEERKSPGFSSAGLDGQIERRVGNGASVPASAF